TLTQLARPLDGLQIDLGLSAAGNPVQQEARELTGIDRRPKRSERARLIRCRSLSGRRRRRIACERIERAWSLLAHDELRVEQRSDELANAREGPAQVTDRDPPLGIGRGLQEIEERATLLRSTDGVADSRFVGIAPAQERRSTKVGLGPRVRLARVRPLDLEPAAACERLHPQENPGDARRRGARLARGHPRRTGRADPLQQTQVVAFGSTGARQEWTRRRLVERAAPLGCE